MKTFKVIIGLASMALVVGLAVFFGLFAFLWALVIETAKGMVK